MSSKPNHERASELPDDPRIELNAMHDESAIAEALRRRRSTKQFCPDQIDLETTSRLLGATVGSAPGNPRPYGSAHARYDIQITVVAAAVKGVNPGAYTYLPEEHALVRTEPGDHRAELAEGTLDAAWLKHCPLILVLSANLSAANRAFDSQGSNRGESFCWFEAGLMSQNIYLWAAVNGLGTVFLGGLDSARMRSATQQWLPRSHSVLGLLPIGYRANLETASQQSGS